MDLLTLLPTLEASLTRMLKSSKNNVDIVTYSYHSNFSVQYTVNSEENTKTNITQVCLKASENQVFLYLNYLARRNYLKININDITSLSVLC